MFIGAGSMSTGGGIKIGTFVVILASTGAYLRQHPQVTIFHRAISDHLVKIVCGDEHLDFDDCFGGVYFNHM